MSMLTTKDGTHKDAKLFVYPGASHGLTDTHKLKADLLAFLKA
jgi:hypothetical protein